MKAYYYIKDLLIAVRDHEAFDRAAVVAYFMLFAIFPFLVGLLALLGLIQLVDEVAILVTLIQDAFPAEIADMLVGEVNRVAFAESEGRVVLGLGLSIYSSQKAMHAAILGVNRAWDRPEKRGFFVERGLGVLLTLAVLLGSALSLLMLSVGHQALDWVSAKGWLEADLAGLLAALRWPVVLAVVHLVINLVYRVGANTPLRWAWSTWGSLSSMVGWVAVTLAFREFVEDITDLGATYGSLGIAAGLLLYFYLLAFIVFLGAEIDALNYKRRKGKQEPGMRLVV